MADLNIDTAAAAPKSATTDGVTVSAHSLDELIKAEKHLAAKTAGANKYRGLRFSKLRPPGTTANSADGN